MLDLLTSTSLLKNTRMMLVACNKVDALPDELAGISPKVMVKKRLEVRNHEIGGDRGRGIERREMAEGGREEKSRRGQQERGRKQMRGEGNIGSDE